MNINRQGAIMATRISKELIQIMYEKYDSGMTIVDISKETNVHEETVRKYIRKSGRKRRPSVEKRIGEEGIKQICDLYTQDKMKDIYELYPDLTKQQIYTIASRHNAKKESYFWSQEETDFLVNNFGKLSYDQIADHFNNKHNANAISTKAIKLGLTSSQHWTKEEEDIIIKYYPYIPMEDVLKMLPRRSANGLKIHALKMGIKGLQYLSEKYSDEQKQFILDNYVLMSDEEIAKVLGKTPVGIKEQKRKLGIYQFNKEYQGYESLSKLLRGQISTWKRLSCEQCGYQCVLTGSKDFEIHHLYSFNKILQEAFEKCNEQGLLKSYNIEDYTKEELDVIIQLFLDIHETYPLGVCVEKDLHKLFHDIYGTGGNVPEQWDDFVDRYKKGEFNNVKAS